MGRSAGIVWVLAVLAVPGCTRGPGGLFGGGGGVTFNEFVNATVALRRAAAKAASPEAFQARKRTIEGQLRITDGELQRFVRDHADQVDFMSAVWDSVEARLARAGAEDAATAAVPQPTPAGRSPASPGTAPAPPARPAPGLPPGSQPAGARRSQPAVTPGSTGAVPGRALRPKSFY